MCGHELLNKTHPSLRVYDHDKANAGSLTNNGERTMTDNEYLAKILEEQTLEVDGSELKD